MNRTLYCLSSTLFASPVLAQASQSSLAMGVYGFVAGAGLAVLIMLYTRALSPKQKQSDNLQTGRLEVYEKAADGILMYEEFENDEGDTDYKLTDANPSCYDVFQNAGFDFFNSTLRQHLRFMRCEYLLEEVFEVRKTGRKHHQVIEIENDVIDPDWLDVQMIKTSDGVAITIRDLTAQYKLAEQQRATQQQVDELLSAMSGHFIYSRTPDCQWRYVSESVSSILGCDASKFKSSCKEMLLKRSTDENQVLAELEQNGESHYRAEYLSNGRGQVSLEHFETAKFDEDGEIAYIHGVARDVSVAKHKQNEMMYQASHDPLTGTLNRFALDRHLIELLEQQDEPTSMMFSYIDLTGISDVNKHFGQTAGDSMLKAVADKLTASLLPGETLARVGGDEFAVVGVDLEEQVAEGRASDFMTCISAVRVGDVDTQMGANIGVIFVRDEDKSPREIFRRAYLASEHSRLSGTNQIFVDN